MFTNRVRLVVLSCVLALAPVLLLSTPAIAAGQQMRKASGMLFQQRVEAYVALHRQCAQRQRARRFGEDGLSIHRLARRQVGTDELQNPRCDGSAEDVAR